MQDHYLHNTLPYLQITPIFTVIQLLVLQWLTNDLFYHKTQNHIFLVKEDLLWKYIAFSDVLYKIISLKFVFFDWNTITCYNEIQTDMTDIDQLYIKSCVSSKFLHLFYTNHYYALCLFVCYVAMFLQHE